MNLAIKVTIRLPEDIARFVEEYRERYGVAHRGMVFVEALHLLQKRELERAYQAAGEEWDRSVEARLWEQTIGDGL